MDEDIVLVTLNYRLGPVGFLTFESEQAPGNLGLRDQVNSPGVTDSQNEYFLKYYPRLLL